MPQSPPEHVHEDAMTRGEPRRAIRVVLRTTEREAGVTGRGWSPTTRPAQGFPAETAHRPR